MVDLKHKTYDVKLYEFIEIDGQRLKVFDFGQN
jgi:hypothetical protein